MKALLNSTKERILSAAEELFAETGVATTSLRTITGMAKVNLAAVNYHFGSKDALIEAVYERRLAPLNKSRLENLDRLEREADGRPLPVQAIVEAFVLPVEGMGRETGRDALVFTKLLAQTYNDAAQYVHKFMSTEQQSVMQRYKKALIKALPELQPKEICWRLHFMSATLHHTIATTRYLELLGGGEGQPDVQTAVKQLIPFLVAGVSAPSGTTPAPSA